MAQSKKLTRSSKDKKFAGVCGGLAEYFDADPTLVRLVVLLLILATGAFPGLLFYIIAAIIMPLEGEK